MVVHHVNHQLHAMLMHHIRQVAEVLHCTVFRVHLAVVSNSIGRTQTSLTFLAANRVDGQKPYRIDSQVTNARNILRHRAEGATMVTYKDGIQRHVSKLHVHASIFSNTNTWSSGQDSS